MNRLLKVFCFCLGAGWLAAMPLPAADYTWIGAGGNASDPSHWTPTGVPGGAAIDTATINNGSTAVVDGTHQFAGAFTTLTVDQSALTLGSGADVQVTGGVLGGDHTTSASTLTINDGATLATTDRFNLGSQGNAHIVISGTSTTAPAILSIAGPTWMGVDVDNVTPSTALIELSGTGEMHIGASGVKTNCHMGLRAGSTGTISMTGNSKFTCDVVEDFLFKGWFNCGDLGGTADIDLSGNASFSVPNSHLGLGTSAGGTGRVVLNDSATLTSKGYVFVGLSTASEASITLNGGTFTAPYFHTEGPGVINFNGGTIKASASSADFFEGSSFTINLKDGGGTLDTDTFNVTVARPIRDSITSTPGAFTKTGTGMLTLSADCTYTGPTIIQKGTLAIAGVNSNSSGITVKNTGTLTGFATESTVPCPLTTVEAGGTVAGPAPGQIFVMSDLKLNTGANLNFSMPGSGPVSAIVANNVLSATGGSVIVNVNYTGSPTSPTTILLQGALDANVTFSLFGNGIPVIDSPDGITAPASLSRSSTELDLLQGGVLADFVPAWNTTVTGNWSANANWGNNPPPHQHPDGVSNTDRGLFIKSFTTSNSAIQVDLDISPRLSSMVFASPNGESYDITPVVGTETITLNPGSLIAQNWNITVLSGSHTVGANLALAKGTGQSIIRTAVDSHLNLNGVLRNMDANAAGITFDGGGNGMSYAPTYGTLSLNGLNTFTGPVVMSGYGRLEIGNIGSTTDTAGNALGKSAPDASNLVINGILAYTGGATVPTTVATDRGFTLAGTTDPYNLGFINYIEVQNSNVNLKFNGQVTTSNDSMFNKTGPGTLTFANAGVNTLASCDIQIADGALVLENGTFNKDRVNVLFQLGFGDFYVGTVAGKAATLKLDKGATLVSQGTTIIGTGTGCNGTMMVAGNSLATLARSINFGIDGGTGTLNIDGTDATHFSTLSCAGTAHFGFNIAGDKPSTANVSLSGYGELHIGAADAGDNTHVGLGAGTTATITMTGNSKLTNETTPGSIDFQGWLQLGDLGGTAIVNLSNHASIDVTKGGVGMGSSSGGVARVTLNDSATFSSKLLVSVGIPGATEASITLNGGTFTAPLFRTTGPGVINFNGGALKASAASDDYIAGTTFTLNVDAGGAKIDTGGFDITVAREFHNISATTPGGLTKLGDGKLTLTAVLTGIGDTTVNQGELNAAAGINTPSDAVYVATGATLTAPTIVADTLSIGGLPKGAAVAVPEPGTLALLAMAGMISVWFAIRRKR